MAPIMRLNGEILLRNSNNTVNLRHLNYPNNTVKRQAENYSNKFTTTLLVDLNKLHWGYFAYSILIS